jgi:hypothetical protein
MPVRNDPAALRTALLAAIQSKSFDPAVGATSAGLSNNEVTKFLTELRKDGVTPDEAKVVVETLVEALKTGYDTSAPREQKSIQKLLDTVDKLAPGAIADKTQFTQSGSTAWLSLLQARAAGGAQPPTPPSPGGGTAPAPPPGPPPGPGPVVPGPGGTTTPTSTTNLPKPSFDGRALDVSSTGALRLGGASLSTDLKSTTDGVSLLSLVRPGQLAGLDATQKAALAGALVDGIAGALPLLPTSDTKFQPAVGSLASLGALAELAPSLSSTSAEKLLALVGKTPSFAQETLLLQALKAAPQTPAIAAAVAGFPSADQQKLLTAFDAFRGETGRVGFTDVKGEAAAAALACLAFAKDQVAVDNISKGLETWSKMDAGYGSDFSAGEARGALKMLEPYINHASTTNLVFGAFAQEAPKAVAKAQNAATVAKLEPLLSASKPSIGGVPLTTEQATFIRTVAAGLKDDAAVTALTRGLTLAHGAFSSTVSSWGTPQAPTQPLSAAAFGAFQRATTVALEGASGTPDGMIDVRALEAGIRSETTALGDSVKPLLTGLAMGVIKDGTTSIPVSPQLASELKALVLDHAKSTMTVPNLMGAAAVVAAKNGGRLDGAGAAQLGTIIRDYMAEFPGAQLLDFNKLGRIASFAVEGKTVPLSTLNGQTVKLAEFYTAVATSVASSITSDIKHPWAGQRWGIRAKQSVELLDVIAQKTAEQSGPVHVLRQQFPGQKVEVLATGKDGEHERFLYKVGTNVFAEASDGRVQAYDTRRFGLEPLLFSAAVRDDGAYDVQVKASATRKYPTQTTYAVGDSVDIAFRDMKAANSYDEGKPFDTQFKVANGTVKGFDAAGNYQVSFKDPQGVEQQKTVTIDELKKYNHPHYFSETSSNFSDVKININTDKALKDFLEGADPIIKAHLPTDGTLLNLSTEQLAKRQKACVEALMKYAATNMKYPADAKTATDAESKEYHRLTGNSFNTFDLGELVKIKKGVCRHQCIAQHLLLQRAGIDSRLASGSANTSSGGFRGFHIWVEISLADNARYLSDQTWSNPYIPLWDGAYNVDKQRAEMYDRTARYDANVVS